MQHNPLDQIPEDGNEKTNQLIAFRMRVAGLWMILASAGAIGTLFIAITTFVLGAIDGWWRPFRTEELVVEVLFLILLARYGNHLATGIILRSRKSNKILNAARPYFAGWLMVAIASVIFIVAFISYKFFDFSLMGDISRAIFELR